MLKNFKCEKDNILLLEYLSDMLGFLPINKIRHQLKSKEIKVNKKRVSDNVLLKCGDEVQIFLPQGFTQSSLNFQIVYEDNNILVVDKPILCDVENHLLSMLKSKYKNIKAVHRLDRNTTGLVVFALNDIAFTELFRAFKNHTVQKDYIAHVSGLVKPDSATLLAYLKKDSKNSLSIISKVPKAGYVKILTEYEVIEHYDFSTLLKVRLHTGKTHQIRAHLSFIGYPIIGDGKYGNKEINKEFGARYQRLHAQKLVFHDLAGELSVLNDKEFIAKNIDEFWNIIYNSK